MATLYDLLGVRDDATDPDIKRAYRKAAMQAHPDRNVGHEAAAHARFLEIKEAYSILSDPDQRRVYDAVYAEEMQRIDRDREAEEARLQAERAEREAEYAKFVTLAMRFAERGFNRDVVLGVLLGRECDEAFAGRIADSVVALHASRQAVTSAESATAEAAPASDSGGTPGAASNAAEATAGHDPNHETRPDDERSPASLFSALWHNMFGLRS